MLQAKYIYIYFFSKYSLSPYNFPLLRHCYPWWQHQSPPSYRLCPNFTINNPYFSIQYSTVGFCSGSTAISLRCGLNVYIRNVHCLQRLNYVEYLQYRRLSVLLRNQNIGSHTFVLFFGIIQGSIPFSRDRGSTVVNVLRYKSVGRWLDPSWCQWIFHWHRILPIALWLWGRLSL